MSAELPMGGWKHYGRPGHPYNPKHMPRPIFAGGNRTGLCIHEIHAEIAEYRLEREGIKPELLRYMRGIGESVRG